MQNVFWMCLSLIIFPGISAGPASASEIGSWEELAAQWLDATYHQPGGRWAASVLAVPPGWNSEALRGRVVITGVAQGAAKAKRIMALSVQHRVSGAQGILKIHAAFLCPVPVANHLLTRGQALTAADWRWEERDQTVLPNDTLRLEKDLEHKRIKKYLCTNEVISAHALEAEPDIPKGRQISLRVQGRGVVINADAEALEEGYIGRGIKVRLTASGKILTASVAGPEAAELVLTGRR
jgi:flagella basal body P-ring formation protein FlgA